MRKYSNPKDAREQRSNPTEIVELDSTLFKITHPKALGLSLRDSSSCCGHLSLYLQRLTDLMLSSDGAMKAIVCL